MAHNDRNDSVQEKLHLLQSAYETGRHDLAMSLAESVKDTLTFERHLSGELPEADIAENDFITVDQLPDAWATWANGWPYCKTIALSETVGIARQHEPVHLNIAFRSDQIRDPYRELRLTRVNLDNNALSQVAVQVTADFRRANQRHCSIVFLADVPAHETSNYLLFYGNSNAELLEIQSNLRVRGEGFGLDIENSHYVARLSRQMGQLERLTVKRQHELELYAGGKGHGEPPTIDWAHDYVDEGNFQKLRMRNWPACPNFEVTKGPLCVQVRRWGFPFSPVHPLDTPSRMHIDQTYAFYAGLPYFIKLGQMEAVKQFRIQAMRDDEWVFSGYSFTDTLWIDSQGKLHEGPIPAAQSENLWGVGFHHRTSRDAFIALRLDHSAKNFDAIRHGGAPTLHYDGHGQLWSRYPAERTEFQQGTLFTQKNAYVMVPFDKSESSQVIERLRHQLVNPVVARSQSLPSIPNAIAGGTLARHGETNDTAALKEAVWESLREVRDEQLYSVDANVVDMGYIYNLRIDNGIAHVLVTMPHRGRPVYRFLETQGGGRVSEGIRERVLRINGVRDVIVEFTWEPAWTVSRLTDAGRRAVGLPD